MFYFSLYSESLEIMSAIKQFSLFLLNCNADFIIYQVPLNIGSVSEPSVLFHWSYSWINNLLFVLVWLCG